MKARFPSALRLADSSPMPLTNPAGAPGDEGAASTGDLAAGHLRVTGPKFDSLDSAAFDFRSAALSPGPEKHLWLRVQDHGLAGNPTLYPLQPPYRFEGRQAP